MTFKEWWKNVPAHELVVDENTWDKQIARVAYRAGQEEMRERATKVVEDTYPCVRKIGCVSCAVFALPLEGDDD